MRESESPATTVCVRSAGTGAAAVDGDAWLTDQGAEGIIAGDAALATCTAGGV